MKTTTEKNSLKNTAVRVDPSMDKYDGVVLFPEKLKKLNEKLLKTGFPNPELNKNDR